MRKVYPLIASLLVLSALILNVSKAQVIDPLLQDIIHPHKSLLSLPTVLPLDVIVTFHGTGAPTSSNLNVLKNMGIIRGVSFQSFPGIGVLATPTQIRQLEENTSVRSIYLNKRLQFYNDYSTELIGVDRLRENPTMIANNGGTPVTGNGVGILINDSGVDGTHQDIEFGDHLVQNVLGTANLSNTLGFLPPTYVENLSTTDISSGHGTHCTGTIGGTGALSDKKYEGVAPGADLIGYGSGAVLFVLDALGGFDYAAIHQQQYNIKVVNNSWGGSGDFDPNDPINIATKALYDKGVVIVFAAGNEGPSPGTLNTYALAPWVVSVAAGDKDRRLAEFSSRGVEGDEITFTLDGEVWVTENRPTLTAPGVDIVSTRAISPLPVLSTQQDINNLDPSHLPYYTHMSGTSMAAPHVSGVVALILEANPLLSPADIKDMLQFTSQPMNEYETWEAGWGYLDAFNAVDYAFFTKQFYQSNGNSTAGRINTTFEQRSKSFNQNQTGAANLSGYPNPFTNSTTIRYTMPYDAYVDLSIFDLRGQKVATILSESQEKGPHQVSIDKGTLNLNPGMYLIKVSAGSYTNMLRIVVDD